MQPSPIKEVQPVPSCLKKTFEQMQKSMQIPSLDDDRAGELNGRNRADATSEPAHLGSGSCKVSTLPDWWREDSFAAALFDPSGTSLCRVDRQSGKMHWLQVIRVHSGSQS